MLRRIKQIFSEVQSGTAKLLLLAGMLLLVWGTLAPIGTLVWWINQDTESLTRRNRSRGSSASDETDAATDAPMIDCYIVFFTGVGDFSADQLAPGEAAFLDRLVSRHPNCVAVRNVFPYSAANESLGGRRILAPFWEFAEEADGWLANADVLIKIRNLWRMALSIDDRYGSVYNQGIATAVVEQMEAVQPIPDSSSHPLKLILIGTSGGAQVALGSAHYLDQWLEARLIVVSIGGDFSGGEGFDAVEQVYHLEGSQDWIEDLGSILFPPRWPWAIGSPVNRAKRQGRFISIVSGPHEHNGARGYFGQTPVPGEDYTYLDLTVQAVNQLPIWSSSENTSLYLEPNL
ncbi:MAG: hypothetical protein Kow00121_62430 [Elainellaceae cyanobacterium]